jgi:hypothetical protein
LVVGLIALASAAPSGCESCGSRPPPGATKPEAPAGLTPELAARVLARVGERTITLGQYAQTLERMDRYERLRYQTADRRKALLDELINVELLAREAEQRGLADKPETRALMQQLLRDEVLRKLREGLPRPEEIPPEDVRAYYEQHQAELALPERRRVEQIALSDRGQAEALLKQALGAVAAGWAALVRRFAPEAAPSEAGDRTDSRPALELSGDVGMVSAPGSGASDNERVPEPVRVAVFQIEREGGVYPELVPHEGRFYVVRLAGKTEARARSLAEAEATVRVRLAEQRQAAAEADLLARLKQEIPVQVDEAALDRVPPPGP